MAPPPRSNQSWLEELRGPQPARDRALEDLRRLLVRGLQAAFRGQAGGRNREFSAHFDDFAQEALVKILASLDTFQGLSQFTTWAHKICVRIAFAEWRRMRWKDVSLDALVDAGHQAVLPPAPPTDPGKSDLLAWLSRAMEEELTPKQRTALQAIVHRGMPMSEVARRLETNRNALYKLLYDARLRLKKRLIRDGMGEETPL